MCDEDIWSDENLQLMFQNMSEEQIKEFWQIMENSRSLSELLKKGYSFSGRSFLKSVFVYKNSPIKLIITN